MLQKWPLRSMLRDSSQCTCATSPWSSAFTGAVQRNGCPKDVIPKGPQGLGITQCLLGRSMVEHVVTTFVLAPKPDAPVDSAIFNNILTKLHISWRI